MKINIKKYAILIFIIMLIPLSGCSINGDKDNDKSVENIDNLSEKQWVEDIDYLYKNLPKSHKNLFFSLKEETFKAEIEKLKDDIPKLKGYEIKCRMSQIVALAKDAHTSVKLNLNGKDSDIYPIELKWFQQDLRIISTEKDKKDILGMKLIAINNIEINQVVDKVNSLISHENSQWVKVINVTYITMPEVLKLLNITSDNKIELTVEDDERKVKKLEIEPKKFNKDNKVWILDETLNNPLRFQGKDTLPDKAYWYKYIPEDKILYFQYNECVDYGVAKDYGFENYKSYPKFDKFSKEFLNELESKDVDKLVVDLRNNGGGNSSLMTSLVDKISESKKLKGRGSICVIIGKKTFSSATINTLDFKKTVNAILIGEETGGNANGYGEVKTLTLPNSKIKVRYSTKYFKLSDKYKEGIVPDMGVDETFEKYKQGIDEVYEAAKDYNIKK